MPQKPIGVGPAHRTICPLQCRSSSTKFTLIQDGSKRSNSIELDLSCLTRPSARERIGASDDKHPQKAPNLPSRRAQAGIAPLHYPGGLRALLVVSGGGARANRGAGRSV